MPPELHESEKGPDAAQQSNLSTNQPDEYRANFSKLLAQVSLHSANESARPINAALENIKLNLSLVRTAVLDTALTDSLHIGLQVDKPTVAIGGESLNVNRYLGLRLNDSTSQMSIEAGVAQGCQLPAETGSHDMFALQATAALDDDVALGLTFLTDEHIGTRGAAFLATAGLTGTF